MGTKEDDRAKKPDWMPPTRNYGGENIPEYFAMMFYDEMITLLFVHSRSNNGRIFEKSEKVIEERDGIQKRLKAQGLYRYEQGGSVFRDYKIMKGRALQKLENETGETDPEKAKELGYQIAQGWFNVDMTTDEAMQKAREFVYSWEWRD